MQSPTSLGLVNARIFTADCARPWAESLRIDNGVISSIDDSDAAAAADQVIDARGRTALPGLIDTHSHFVMGGESLLQLDLSGITSRAAFERAIARRHAELPPDRWLLAHGWNEENWGGSQPDRAWLSAAGDRPCVVYRMDSHVCVVNDAVMRLCDLSHEPEGGRIARDVSGQPTGLFIEAAAWKIINTVIPARGVREQREAARRAMDHVTRLGLTTMGSMEYQRTVRDVLQPLRDQLSVRLRVTLLDRDLPIDFSFGESFADDARLAIIGYKSYLDGTLGARTARMCADYADDPGNRGMWCEHAAVGTLGEWIASIAARGFQPTMHAIGDEAARMALDVIESVIGDDLHARRRLRPRIEHAQTVRDDDLPRLEGIIASMQPLHRADDGRFAERRLGRARLSHFFRFRDLLEHRAILAFGSDWPIVSCDPMLGLRAAITCLTIENKPVGPDQALTVDEAFYGYTIDAAYALKCDDAVGSLQPGKFGDLIILDRDPFTLDWTTATPRVVLTVLGGVSVFDDDAE